ncbi:hypothetical protein ACHAPE_002293 [Trichoderma viride]
MAEAPIDPQLDLLACSQGNPAAGAMAYSYPEPSLEPWTSLFDSMGDFSQVTQDPGLMDSDPYSDTASSLSFGNDQTAQFLMSPIQGASSFNPDDSPSNTSISELGGSSKPETSTNTNTNMNSDINANINASSPNTTRSAPKPTKSTKSKRGTRRSRSDSNKQDLVKLRNRVAATKCRQKKKVNIDNLKEMQSLLQAQNDKLRAEFQQLRMEVGEIKNDLINHTGCNDANINRWVENEAKGFVKKLVTNGERQRMESISSIEGNPMAAMPMQPFEGASNMPLDDPYMGLE